MIKDMPYILRGLERVSNGKGIEIVLQYDRSGNRLHEYRANQHHSVLRKWLETVVFYRNTFFFPISYQNDWFVEFQLTDRAYLSVADERRASVRSVAGQGIALSWQVSNLSELYAMFMKQGVTVSEVRRMWGAALFYLHDPEGHRIELWQPNVDGLSESFP